MDGHIYNVTRGRPKRKRKPGAGSAVKVGSYRRSPRGPNRKNGKKKPTVVVDGYKRGKPKKRKRSRR